MNRFNFLSGLVCAVLMSVQFPVTAADADQTAVETSPSQRFRIESTGRKLYVKHLCYECHRPVETHIAPSLETIAMRYANEEDRTNLIERLSTKIIDGGYGNWGILPMNSNPEVTSEEAAKLAEWIIDPPP
jgi:cytochrome c